MWNTVSTGKEIYIHCFNVVLVLKYNFSIIKRIITKIINESKKKEEDENKYFESAKKPMDFRQLRSVVVSEAIWKR